MNHRTDRSSRFTRITTTLGLAGVAAIAIAARTQTAQPPQVQPSPAPPHVAPAIAPAQKDSQKTFVDSVPTNVSPAVPVQTPAPTVAPKTAGKWPVDPVTGLTLVNGTPVVGRVFEQRKVDGLVKYQYSEVYKDEPPHPAAPIVSARHEAPAPGHARRMRGIMVEATLWTIDNKRSARELRMYRPVTPPPVAGQH